jgi:sarcosine oxidase subunit beta
MGSVIVPGQGDLPRAADFIVVGGGIIGCATAFYASEGGFSTVVLEQRDGLGTLTTAASEECFRAQFDEPENIRMMMESIAVFENFPEVIRLPGYDISVCQQGYLFMSDEPDALRVLRARVKGQHDLGLKDVEFLDGDEARRRFPFAGPQVVAATFRNRDGWLSAHELTYGFARGSSALFALRTRVTGIRLDAQGVCAVCTERGEIATRCVVVAAGPFSGVVASLAGAELPLMLLRRQKVVLGSVPVVPACAPMTIDLATGVYWRPEVAGAALGWALPEEPSEPMEKVPTDWTFPAVALEGAGRLTPFWNEVADTLTRENVFISAGQYTCTPDNKPVIGAVSSVPGLHVNAGYSGHGVMASPAGAKLLVNLVANPSAEAANPFRLGRFVEASARAAAECMVI